MGPNPEKIAKNVQKDKKCTIKIYIEVIDGGGNNVSSSYEQALKNMGAEIKPKLSKHCSVMVWNSKKLDFL